MRTAPKINDMMRRPYVGVVGAGLADDELLNTARAVGRLVAERGGVVVCGGLGGVMEAACRGGEEAGGTTVGILPGLDRRDANPHVDVAIPTGMGEMRNVLVVRASDVVIAIGGEYGTLSEIAFALKTGVPVVGLKVWELVKDGATDRGIRRASNPREAVDLAFSLTP